MGVSSILYHRTCGIHLMGGRCMVSKYSSSLVKKSTAVNLKAFRLTSDCLISSATTVKARFTSTRLPRNIVNNNCCEVLRAFLSVVSFSIHIITTQCETTCYINRDERECLFQSHSIPFPTVHSHSQSQV